MIYYISIIPWGFFFKSRKHYHLWMIIPACWDVTDFQNIHPLSSFTSVSSAAQEFNSSLLLISGSVCCIFQELSCNPDINVFSCEMFLSQPQGIRQPVPWVLSECFYSYNHQYSCCFCVISIVGVKGIPNIYYFMLNTEKKSFIMWYCFPQAKKSEFCKLFKHFRKHYFA